MLAAFLFALVVQVPVGLVLSLILVTAPHTRGVVSLSAVAPAVLSFLALVSASFNLAEAMVGGNAHYQDATAFSVQSLASEWPVYVIALLTGLAGAVALYRFSTPEH